MMTIVFIIFEAKEVKRYGKGEVTLLSSLFLSLSVTTTPATITTTDFASSPSSSC